MTAARSPVEEVGSWASKPRLSNVTVPIAGVGFNLESFIARHLLVRRGPLPWDNRGRKWELETCPFNPEHTGGFGDGVGEGFERRRRWGDFRRSEGRGWSFSVHAPTMAHNSKSK